MDENAIVTEGLRYRFKGATQDALAELGFAVRTGRITGLAGPDGAGKTTLLRLLAGLLTPQTGCMRVGGCDPATQAGELHGILGYMPQKFGLYEDLSVLENLTLFAQLRGLTAAEKEASFARLLSFTGLEPFRQRPAGKLSGGMKQKLGLACALLGRPRILLLDEPCVGVDPISRRELWRMVTSLADEGMAVIWSTSYLEEAERCGEVILLSAGRAVFCGAPAAAVEPLRGRTRAVAGIATAERRAVLKKLLALPQVMDGILQGSRLRVLMRDTDAGALDSALPPQARTHTVEPHMEDVFIDKLGGVPKRRALTYARESAARDAGTQAPVVEAMDLTRRFGDFTAADHISFAVPRGHIFGLLGPNGAGKSTTFKMLCGLLPPSEGNARIMGLDLKSQAPQARQKLGYMAQKFALYTNLSVAQNLAFFSGIYGLGGAEQKRRVAEAAEAFALIPHLAEDAGELPLGFKQRLALACATMHRPDVLFLDEPTSGVDPVARREFWQQINAFVETGVTVIVTTHFMEEAEYCDEAALVYRGRIIAQGHPEALKAQSGGGDPTMEEAFIRLIETDDAARKEEA